MRAKLDKLVVCLHCHQEVEVAFPPPSPSWQNEDSVLGCRPRILGPQFSSSTLLERQKFHTGRGKPKRPVATVAAQPVEWWLRCLEEEAVHKNREHQSSPQRDWFYSKQSIGKFKSQDALKNNGDLKSEQIRGDWDSFLIKSKKLNHWPASLEKRIRAKNNLPEVRTNLKDCQNKNKNHYCPNLIGADRRTSYAPEHCLKQ